ncbi:endonuclease III [Bdellovibrionota bacterium]
MDQRQRASKILKTLEKEFPEAKTSLKAKNPYEFLISVILSAQCTDKRVNQETPKLFSRWPNAKALAQAKPKEVEKVIKPLGFFRNKTKSIIGCAKGLVEKHGGRVPSERKNLEALPGVGRKTANVVLGNIFDQPALAVDTHVMRISKRLGLTKQKSPEKIEIDLCKIIPKKKWALTTNLLILHGRKTCKAPKPRCTSCSVSSLCAYYKSKD